MPAVAYTVLATLPDEPTASEYIAWLKDGHLDGRDRTRHMTAQGTAVQQQGRVGVLYSNKDYGCEWDYDWRNKRFQREDNTKFGVNVVVYAMTS